MNLEIKMAEQKHGHPPDRLDGWRGVAILAVLAGQLFPLPGLDLALVGGGLLLALSGKRMARELFLTRLDLPGFWRRRIAGIAPGMLAFVGCMAMLSHGSSNEIGLGQVAASLSFTSNYFLDGVQPAATPLGHLWLPAVVMQSCLLMSFIALLVRRKVTEAAYAVGCTAAVFAACAVAYWALDGRWRFTSVYRFHLEVAGAAVFASGFLALWWKPSAGPQLRWAVPALSLALESRVLRQFGAWSFSLYLWQQPFHLMVKQGAADPVAGLLGALAAGIAACHLIERPARTWLNRNWAPRARLTLVYSSR